MRDLIGRSLALESRLVAIEGGQESQKLHVSQVAEQAETILDDARRIRRSVQQRMARAGGGNGPDVETAAPQTEEQALVAIRESYRGR